MSRTTKKGAKEREPTKVELGFARVVDSFVGHDQVTREEGKGFGSGALKVNGKTFAMISSKGQFVVKLPKERVDELVGSFKGERFDPGHGRLMKEWVTVGTARVNWVEVATEAFDFMKGDKR